MIVFLLNTLGPNRRVSLHLCLSPHFDAIPRGLESRWGRVGGGHRGVSSHWCHQLRCAPVALPVVPLPMVVSTLPLPLSPFFSSTWPNV